MHAVSLNVSNFMRLEAIEVKFKEKIVEFTGENGVGKSAILNAIETALCGKNPRLTKPIRAGEEAAIIKLDLGHLKVTRRFNKSKNEATEGEVTSSLIVETEEGARFQKPQQVLDALIGELSFDPLGFIKRKPSEQVEALKVFVPGVDFAEIETANKKDYDARTLVNRDLASAKARLVTTIMPEGAPTARVDESALLERLNNAGQTNTAIETTKGTRQKFADDTEILVQQAAAKRSQFDEIGEQIVALQEQIVALQERAVAIDKEATFLNERIVKRRADLAAAAPVPDPIDTTALLAEINEARQANALFDAAERAIDNKASIETTVTDLQTKTDALTKAMEDRTASKAKAVAEAKMPVEGLSFGDGEVLFNGQPFAQASSAEQIRASVAIAAAMNPKLRIAFIRDGSLLDKKSWALLCKFAEANDLQVFVESVESSRPSAIEIVAGRLASDPAALQAAE